MKTLSLRIITFTTALLTGISGYWIVMLMLTILTAHGFVNLYKLSDETQEVILNIRCDEDDLFCRGEKCKN